jgi:hypothetical protein
MMDELVNLVVSKTGVSEAIAQQAVEIVMGFLKEKLPDPIAAQLDQVLEGADLSDAGDVLSGLGGILGR